MTGKKGMNKDKDFKVTPQFFEAGERNLQKWKDENPQGGAITHGAFSSSVRKRYTDLRTTEGKQLQGIIDRIRADLGGDLDEMQNILLARIKEKLLILIQIGQYVDLQESVIQDGDLIGCLSSSYIAYDNSLTRSLTLLYNSIGKKKSRKIPSLDQWIDIQNEDKENEEN